MNANCLEEKLGEELSKAFEAMFIERRDEIDEFVQIVAEAFMNGERCDAELRVGDHDITLFEHHGFEQIMVRAVQQCVPEMLDNEEGWNEMPVELRCKFLEAHVKAKMAESATSALLPLGRAPSMSNFVSMPKTLEPEPKVSSLSLVKYTYRYQSIQFNPFSKTAYYRKLVFCNDGSTRLAYQIMPVTSHPLFKVTPQRGFICPGEQFTVKVRFAQKQNMLLVLFEESEKKKIGECFNKGESKFLKLWV